ncbi:hypothetical protein T484DRAFT_1615406, partial [Baffinella frigidus]
MTRVRSNFRVDSSKKNSYSRLILLHCARPPRGGWLLVVSNEGNQSPQTLNPTPYTPHTTPHTPHTTHHTPHTTHHTP